MILLGQMVILFLLMAVGFACRKNGLLTESGSKVLSGLVVNIANPALILSASINKENTIQGIDLLKTAALAVGVFVFLILISLIIPIVLRAEKKNKGTYQVMTVFSNIGFMGFPVISATYGPEALLHASFFLIPFNILVYTWGISALVACNKDEKKEKENIGIAWKKIFNVGVIACILTIIIYLLRLPVPAFIENTVNHLANLTAPLSMMVIGSSIGDMEFKKLFTDIKLIIFSLIKLFVIPIIGLLFLKIFNFNEQLMGVCLIMLATPVASMTAMLAQQYDGDYDLSSRGVALTTILSVISMPLVSLLLGV